MERLRRERVLFGVSLTATRENAEEILSDPVIDLCFEKLGALYGWVFHYMPIGRAYTLDLMATPQQRMQLWHRLWELVRERRLFIADFWNSGTATNGCVAGGRPGGYLHIDWNGHVSPCVFVPYSPVNLRDAYAQGKTLDDIWAEPFFAGIRDWQRDYGYRENGEQTGDFGNWLTPCLIRDHHGDFQRLMRCHAPQAVNEDAAAAQADAAYHKGLEIFDCQLAELADPVWTERYLDTVGKPRDRS
jgi:MoaA/NifB/PqqE/SkfB family radical SAM enzyme